MMNSLYQQLNPQRNTTSLPQNNSNELVNLAKQFAAGGISEQQAKDYILKMNPNLGMLFSGNINYKNLFYMMAQKKGIDPNTIISLFN